MVSWRNYFVYRSCTRLIMLIMSTLNLAVVKQP